VAVVRRGRSLRVHLLVLGVVGLCTTGCRGWGRVQAGGAYDLRGRQNTSGQVIAADLAVGSKKVRWGNEGRPFPFVLHTSADVLLAPDRKSFGWGTGIGVYREPRPIAPYALLGSSLHLDDVRGRFSFGNVSPYGEVGLLTSVPSRYQDGGDGWILSVGVTGASYVNFLVGNGDTLEGYFLLKLGVGWEKN
jgi:hypothetical protein